MSREAQVREKDEFHASLRTDKFSSLYGVWFRHWKVYSQTFVANALPPVMEPLFFFTALAFGLGPHLPDFEGMTYRTYIGSGIVCTSAMFTAVFETTFGTFIRLVFQKAYDSMLGTHLLVSEMFTGELLFTASKGFLFSLVVMVVTGFLGAQLTWWCVFVPLVGALTGYLFGALGLVVCSHVKTINNFNFFLTGVVTPMFILSGCFFPVKDIPIIGELSLFVPLTHAVEMCRALYGAQVTPVFFLHLGVLFLMSALFHRLAIRRMSARVLG